MLGRGTVTGDNGGIVVILDWVRGTIINCGGRQIIITNVYEIRIIVPCHPDQSRVSLVLWVPVSCSLRRQETFVVAGM